MHKSKVRELAASIDLRTADKPDSQDVCFITSTGGRTSFLGDRIPFNRADVVDTAGAKVGEVESVEMVTIGQRKGLGLPGGGPKRYVVDVDTQTQTVTVGADSDLLRDGLTVRRMAWVNGPSSGEVLVQASAHGTPQSATINVFNDGVDDRVDVVWADQQRRIAPGQSVVFYDLSDTSVLGGGIAD
jgi:tRNA-specific 2-thiouridylase